MPIINVENKEYNTVNSIQFVFHINLDYLLYSEFFIQSIKYLQKKNCNPSNLYTFYDDKSYKSKDLKFSKINIDKFLKLFINKEIQIIKVIIDSDWKLNHYDLFTDKYPFYYEINLVKGEKINMQISISIDETFFNNNFLNIETEFINFYNFLSKYSKVFYGYSFVMDKIHFPKVYLNGGEYEFASNNNSIINSAPKAKELVSFNKNKLDFDNKIWRVFGNNILNSKQIKNIVNFKSVSSKLNCKLLALGENNYLFSLPRNDNFYLNENSKISQEILKYLNY